MNRKLIYQVTREEETYVARCLAPEIASDGATEEEAIAALQEALELYFEDFPDDSELDCPDIQQ